MLDRTTRQDTPYTTYGRNLLPDLMKVYNNNEFKYSGGEYDFLNKKLQIFYELCSKVGIHLNEYETAYSTMLQGSALSFYFDRISNKGLKFEEMITLTKTHFETEERRQKYLTEWRNTTFPQIIRKHPDKSLSEQLEKLFDTLRTLQYGLVDSYQSELMLRDQIINACRDVPECNPVLLRPATTYEGLCADLRNAIGQAERMRSTNTYIADSITNNLPGTEIYWTDRTYGGRGSYRNRGQYRARSRGRFTPSRSYSPANSSKRLQYSQTPTRTSIQKCFVCKQPGCWSTNHTKEERKTKFNQYMMEQEMDEEIFEQYLLRYEGASESQYEKDEILEEDDNFGYPQTESSNNQMIQFETHFTEIGSVNGAYVAELLGRQSLMHTYLQNDQFNQSYEKYEKSDDSNEVFQFQDRYSANTFQGIIPDTGASGVSTAGEFQVQALEREKGISRTKGAEHNIKFGKGTVRSQGDITVQTPIGIITFFIVSTNTPFLICIQDMDRLHVTLDNISNVLRQGDKAIPIVRKWGHPFMLLDQVEETVIYHHLTENELRQIHRRFGHPSVRKLINILNRAGHTDIDSQTIEKLNKVCKHCQLHTKSPGRFKFTINEKYRLSQSKDTYGMKSFCF
ncbi:hypothetical protein EAE99_005811 [Botrytis elliptica]|nr:hypothetical protein EAE99_005811 [Botrytis elliptica]